MFALSIALLALAVISAAFGILGVAGFTAIIAALGLLSMSGASMFAYWRRREA